MYRIVSKAIAISLPKEPTQQIQGEGEHIGVVILSRDGVQGLQVSELQGSRRLIHYISSFTQLLGCPLLPFSCHHLNKVQKGMA